MGAIVNALVTLIKSSNMGAMKKLRILHPYDSADRILLEIIHSPHCKNLEKLEINPIGMNDDPLIALCDPINLPKLRLLWLNAFDYGNFANTRLWFTEKQEIIKSLAEARPKLTIVQGNTRDLW